MSTLTWDEAVEQAMKPTERDRVLDATPGFLSAKKRINERGEMADRETVRFRAAKAYIAAHAGEQVRVTFIDRRVEKEYEASGLDQYSRAVYRVDGELKDETLRMPNFKGPDEYGFVVGDALIPYNCVSEIRTADDRGILIL